MNLRSFPAARPEFVYTVSRLNREARITLSGHFGTVWVEGEVSNVAAPASGHLYFTLKDAEAQVRCAMFRGSGRLLGFKPANGDHVLARAQVGLYEPRGDYQLIVDLLEEAGDGALQRAFEALKKRLDAEGLFDPARKKPIPRFPACIGVITSPTGAAIRDILTVLARRYPAATVIVFPATVQGSEAPAELVRALQRADASGWCDVLLLARGGGSLEDLWAFNDESLARAIVACRTPVVTGIGHEVDFTIADFAADLRAPTPSAAAESVTPDRIDLANRLQRLASQLRRSFRGRLERVQQRLDFVERRLLQSHPRQRLERQAQRLAELRHRLARNAAVRFNLQRQRLQGMALRLVRHDPDQRVKRLAEKLGTLDSRLRRSASLLLERRSERLGTLGQRLDTVSPLATLARGYSIALRAADNTVVHSWEDIQPGEILYTRLAEGSLLSRVEKAEPGGLPVFPGQSRRGR
ncbi:exodeoxyribonuclease VII large subunit [Methylococcus geothermalis]|uniref:Exodeoxyribonuclease 7 large subunit n=1 Tax=Methylococcus geothermalis TaxID=2681310 RepID=A0A858Q8U2_9GAMM|nr:exodeoxyribonuclease VII large subunit [Methylococcus geothermalis]QJD30298.1 exodeoxyribonuclease VII large subunit [Methylococcus geothermalis]